MWWYLTGAVVCRTMWGVRGTDPPALSWKFVCNFWLPQNLTIVIWVSVLASSIHPGPATPSVTQNFHIIENELPSVSSQRPNPTTWIWLWKKRGTALFFTASPSMVSDPEVFCVHWADSSFRVVASFDTSSASAVPSLLASHVLNFQVVESLRNLLRSNLISNKQPLWQASFISMCPLLGRWGCADLFGELSFCGTWEPSLLRAVSAYSSSHLCLLF